VGGVSALLVDLGAGPATGTVPVVLVVSSPAQNPEPPPGQGPEFGKASPVALVVIVLLGLATVLLIRGMNKRIRRLPTAFEDPAAPKSAPKAAAPETTGAAPTVPESPADGDRER
jgi:hypothetical protein